MTTRWITLLADSRNEHNNPHVLIFIPKLRLSLAVCLCSLHEDACWHTWDLSARHQPGNESGVDAEKHLRYLKVHMIEIWLDHLLFNIENKKGKVILSFAVKCKNMWNKCKCVCEPAAPDSIGSLPLLFGALFTHLFFLSSSWLKTICTLNPARDQF